MLVLFMNASFVSALFARKVVNVALSCNLENFREPSRIRIPRASDSVLPLITQVIPCEHNGESSSETFSAAAEPLR